MEEARETPGACGTPFERLRLRVAAKATASVVVDPVLWAPPSKMALTVPLRLASPAAPPCSPGELVGSLAFEFGEKTVCACVSQRVFLAAIV